jgi:hypothetical protein
MTRYEQMCLDSLARAIAWDQSNPDNRAGVRRARWRLWQARYGRYAAALVGALAGTAVGMVLYTLVRGLW